MKYDGPAPLVFASVYEAGLPNETVTMAYVTGPNSAAFQCGYKRRGGSSVTPLFPPNSVLAPEAKSTAVPITLQPGDQIWLQGDAGVTAIIN